MVCGWSHINKNFPYSELRDGLNVMRALRWVPNPGFLEDVKHEQVPEPLCELTRGGVEGRMVQGMRMYSRLGLCAILEQMWLSTFQEL